MLIAAAAAVAVAFAFSGSFSTLNKRMMESAYFLPPDEAKTVEEIEALAEADRKKALGRLIGLMRERIVVNQVFDKQLDQFVEDRNALAHRFLKIDGVSLRTEEGVKKGIEFLKALSAQADHVRKTSLAQQ